MDIDLGATIVCIIDKLCLLERPKPSWELLVGSPQARWAAGPPVAPNTGAVLRSSPFPHSIQSRRDTEPILKRGSWAAKPRGCEELVWPFPKDSRSIWTGFLYEQGKGGAEAEKRMTSSQRLSGVLTVCKPFGRFCNAILM